MKNFSLKSVLGALSILLYIPFSFSQITVFSYTGGPQTYTVPPGVTSIQIEAWGAQGQAITDEQYDESIGGLGGYAVGELTVTPGDVLNVYVGGTGTELVAGYNGGALGGFGTPSDGDAGRAGSGGGASDVRVGGVALANRVIVGGGGGGGGRDYVNGTCQPCGTGGNGGAGGALIGIDGDDPADAIYGIYFNPGSGGSGGTQVAGGAGGDGPEGPDGNPGVVGVGGIGIDGNFSIASGGGGGGYYGGGAGAGANWGSGDAGGGGAGGSSYIGGVTSGSTTPGIRLGNGQVIIEVLCTGLTTVISSDSICLGDSFTLEATSETGGVVTWDGGIINGVPFTPVATGITTYTATSSSMADCGFNIDIEVFENPTVTITTDVPELCDGETITFTEGGDADTYVWDPVDVISGTPYTPAAVGTTTYTLTGTNDLTGCETVETIDITVHPLPTVTASVDFDEICLGEAVIFNGGGADSYTWDMGVTDGVAFTPAAIGTVTYTVTGTSADGCVNTASIDVTVNDAPVVTASADDTEICEGETVTLTGGGAFSYTWDMGVTDGVAFTPAAFGLTTYTVTGATALGCENTATIDITYSPLPTVTAAADDETICLGEMITLSGSGTDTYTWDMGVTDGVAFAPASVGVTTYTVTGTDAVSGCENTATIDITVEDVPAVTAAISETDICIGESVIFNGAGADDYTWDMGVTDGVAFTPIADGTFTYTVTGTTLISGCTNTASVNLTVHPNPSVVANATSLEICLGEPLTLTGAGAATYTWDMGVTNGVAFTPAAMGTTTYTVTGTSAFGCVATDNVTVSVIDCEPVVPSFLVKSIICQGECVKIEDTSTGPATEWEWDFGGAADPATSTIQNPTICLDNIGDFVITLNVTSASGVVSTTTNNITVYPNPTITSVQDTIIDIGGSANLIAVSSATGDFSWLPENNTVECPDCPITTASPEVSTTYTATIVDQNGCRDTDTVMVLVNYVEGVGVPTAFSPNGDGQNDVLYVKGYALEAISLVVYNRYGQIVFETADQNIGWDGTFKGRDENPGVFTWVLQYNFIDGRSGTQKGNTTLIR
jgi:gliding motility-associated-like protein